MTIGEVLAYTLVIVLITLIQTVLCLIIDSDFDKVVYVIVINVLIISGPVIYLIMITGWLEQLC